MEYDDFFRFAALYQTQAGMVDSIWYYFSTVTLAIVGFTVGAKTAIPKPQEARWVISGGYLVFSVGSAASLWYGQSDLCKFANLVKETGYMAPSTLTPFWVVFFQGIVIVTVLVAIHFTMRDQAPNST